MNVVDLPMDAAGRIDPSVIEWKDPPPPRGLMRGGRWTEVANELRRQPGQWARIRVGGSSTMASDIKAGRTKGFEPPGSFDAVGRASAENPTKSDIYARYIGEAEA